jgi:hypothetical protein
MYRDLRAPLLLKGGDFGLTDVLAHPASMRVWKPSAPQWLRAVSRTPDGNGRQRLPEIKRDIRRRRAISGLTPEARAELRISDALVRFPAGLEPKVDLLAGIERALQGGLLLLGGARRGLRRAVLRPMGCSTAQVSLRATLRGSC